jgi:hypothetical protein
LPNNKKKRVLPLLAAAALVLLLWLAFHDRSFAAAAACVPASTHA